MNWFDFIFSNQPGKRYKRHVIFWLAWWLYFSGSYFFTQQGLAGAVNINRFLILFFKSFLLLPGHAFLTYIIVLFLLPRILLRTQYFFFCATLICTIAVVLWWSYCCYALFFPSLDTLFHLSTAITKKTLTWSSITAGPLSALKIVAAAIAIKLLKRWWLKQKETERLEKENISVELQLLKAQLHPDVLFSSLESIYAFVQTNPAKASELLLKLADLLSYMLYECDQAKVPLAKEIKMLKNYMELEKARWDDGLEMSIVVKGELEDKMIAPLLLLPFVENSFLHGTQQKIETQWINVDIRIEEGNFSMKLVNGISIAPETIALPQNNGFVNVCKRLDLLYPNANEMRVHTEGEMMITSLTIKLEEGDGVERTIQTDNDFITSQSAVYATE
ncbi:MAG: histidine kinase [Bacteroidota bacterium]|nr:histidine kinase [Bacteroidota bacterium]